MPLPVPCLEKQAMCHDKNQKSIAFAAIDSLMQKRYLAFTEGQPVFNIAMLELSIGEF